MIPSSILDLPVNIIESILEECDQCTLTKLTKCNRLFYNLGVKRLYRRIYLSDSISVESKVYKSSKRWSVLSVKDEELQKIRSELGSKVTQEALFSDETFGGDKLRTLLNGKLRILINSMKVKDYANLVEELWLDQDLSYDLQNELVRILMMKSKSIKRIDSVLDRKIMETICYFDGNAEAVSQNEETRCMINSLGNQLGKKFCQLSNLELCSENYYIPGKISTEYMESLKQIFFQFLEVNNYCVDTLSLFSNPLALLDAFEMTADEVLQIKNKLKIKSLVYHVREDKFPNNFNHFDRLCDIIECESLKSLTVICWLIQDTAFNRFISFSSRIYENFSGLEDVNLISMIVDEKVVCDFVKSLKNLKRFRFHHLMPGKFVNDSNSKLIQCLVKYQGNNLRYLDINFYHGEHELYWYNYFESRVEINEGCCDCQACAEVKTVILPKKLFGKAGLNGNEEYDNRDILKLIFRKGLIPYTFSFDKYPSFVNRVKIEAFLERFNGLNGTTIDEGDFCKIFKAMVHHQMRHGFEFFMSNFPNLEKLVVNDIPFVVESSRAGENVHDSFRMVFPFEDFLCCS